MLGIVVVMEMIQGHQGSIWVDVVYCQLTGSGDVMFW